MTDFTRTDPEAPTDALFRRLEAVMGLYATLDLRVPLPPLGDWAIDPVFAVLLVNTVVDVAPGLIVECGAGTSTVVAGAALRRHGIEGRIVSLEADAVYADVARSYVRRQGLEPLVTVLHAPLVEGPHGRWYDRAGLDAELGEDTIDLLVVDGPSTAAGGELARSPALPALHDRLSAAAAVLIDDAARPGEQQMLAEWQSDYPDVLFTFHWTQNGAGLGLRSPGV